MYIYIYIHILKYNYIVIILYWVRNQHVSKQHARKQYVRNQEPQHVVRPRIAPPPRKEMLAVACEDVVGCEYVKLRTYVRIRIIHKHISITRKLVRLSGPQHQTFIFSLFLNNIYI